MRKQIGLKLDPAQIEALDIKAKAAGITRTEAVEAAIAGWLDAPAPVRRVVTPTGPASERQAAFRAATADVPLGRPRPAPGSMLKGGKVKA